MRSGVANVLLVKPLDGLVWFAVSCESTVNWFQYVRQIVEIRLLRIHRTSLPRYRTISVIVTMPIA